MKFLIYTVEKIKFLLSLSGEVLGKMKQACRRLSPPRRAFKKGQKSRDKKTTAGGRKNLNFPRKIGAKYGPEAYLGARVSHITRARERFPHTYFTVIERRTRVEEEEWLSKLWRVSNQTAITDQLAWTVLAGRAVDSLMKRRSNFGRSTSRPRREGSRIGGDSIIGSFRRTTN